MFFNQLNNEGNVELNRSIPAVGTVVTPHQSSWLNRSLSRFGQRSSLPTHNRQKPLGDRRRTTRSTNLFGTFEFNTYLYRTGESNGVANISVNRVGGSSGTVSVQYKTNQNTATSGVDYMGTGGTTLTFQPGETSKTFSIPILSDTAFETTEVLRLYLTNATGGATIATDRRRDSSRKDMSLLSILNDDLPTESQLQGRATSRVTNGATTIYVGTHQVSTGNDIGNQDPWAASFTNGRLNWYRDNYEITPDDGRGTHLVWNGTADTLYGAFTATGTQGTPSQDFRRFATNGWLKSYTDYSPHGGGGARVGILARINPATGDITAASYLTALNGMKTNSVAIKSLAVRSNGNLSVAADSAFAPRKADRSAMVRNGQPTTSPNYWVDFLPNLSSVVSARAADYT